METCSIFFIVIMCVFNSDIRTDVLNNKEVIIQNGNSPITYCRYKL